MILIDILVFLDQFNFLLGVRKHCVSLQFCKPGLAFNQELTAIKSGNSSFKGCRKMSDMLPIPHSS